jgi:hypothetical protein
MRDRVKEHDAVRVVVNLVFHNPCVPCFKSKHPFATAFSNLVVQNNCVARVLSTKSNVGFVVLGDDVLFYVCITGLNQENALAVVALNGIVADSGRREVCALDSGVFVLLDRQVLLNSREVVLARADNATALVLKYAVEPDLCITSQIIARLR